MSILNFTYTLHMDNLKLITYNIFIAPVCWVFESEKLPISWFTSQILTVVRLGQTYARSLELNPGLLPGAGDPAPQACQMPPSIWMRRN